MSTTHTDADLTTTESSLTSALAVILARARCADLHDQVQGGRCVSCISWAKNVGVPRHLPRLLHATTSAPSSPVADTRGATA